MGASDLTKRTQFLISDLGCWVWERLESGSRRDVKSIMVGKSTLRAGLPALSPPLPGG
jgi:hypothetical protein